jgi:recombination protein U
MNYPNGQRSKLIFNTKKEKKMNNARLGINFEELINKSNEYYLKNNIAVVYKKPTPIQITKVDYPSRNKAKITEAFYKIPSTTDYNGIYKGYYIDFEAKSCKGTSFPFKSIYQHQLEHLQRVQEHGGIAFLLIMFNDFKEIFLLKSSILLKLYQNSLNGGRKSIPYEFFKENAESIKLGYLLPVDYITAINNVFLRGHNNA